MNTFKKTFFSAALIAVLFITGCAHQPPQAAAPMQDPRTAFAAAIAECATSIERIATSAGGDVGSRVAAVGAIERMCGAQGSVQLAAMQPVQPQQSLGGMLWNGAVQLVDVALRAYGIKASRDVAITQSNNQASTTIASYGAFQGMGASIERAGSAGYPYVQAPGSTTTNTWSVPGNGNNFGSGPNSYTANPITGSYNPVNPASRLCVTTATGAINCSP